jgi:hypothetical protein
MIEALGGLLAGPAGDAVKNLMVGWLAQGLGFLIEWFWTTVETAETPRLTERWFANELFGQVALVALGVTVIMMLGSAIQGALAGRPDQTVMAVKHAVWAVIATMVMVTVMTEAMWWVDEASRFFWDRSRGDLRSALDGLVVAIKAAVTMQFGFLAVLIMLVLYLGLMGLAIALGMRGALIYLVAALCPLAFSASVLPMFREAGRKIVHTMVALVFGKLATVISLVVCVKLLGNSLNLTSTGDLQTDAAKAFGAMVTAAAMFLIAAVTPVVIYRLMPIVEGAAVSSGIAGGWSRGMMSTGYAANSASSMAQRSLARRPTPGGAGRAGGGAKPPPPTGGGGAATGKATAAGGAAGPAAVPLAALKAAKTAAVAAKGVGDSMAAGVTGGGGGPKMRASASPGAAGGGGAGGASSSGSTPVPVAPRPSGQGRADEIAAFDRLIDQGWLAGEDGSDY